MLISNLRSSFPSLANHAGRLLRKSQLTTRFIGSESGAYDGDGQTTVEVLGDKEPHLNLISSYSNKGFRLQNNLLLSGSILLFPTHIYSWAVRRGIDINPESLLIFDLIVPKLKMVIIGYGQQDEPYDPTLRNHFRSRGISCEILPTPHAIPTYNFLVCDSVHVAGAFIPVRDPVQMTSQDAVDIHGHDRFYNSNFFPDYGHPRETHEYTKERYENIGPQKKYKQGDDPHDLEKK